MGLGQFAQLGHLGDDPFATLGVDLGVLLEIHGETFPVSRQAGGPVDVYAQPLASPTNFTATLLLVEQDMKEKPTEAGGKRFEVLTLIGQPGTLLENDILAHGGHNYDVWAVFKSTMEKAVQSEVYEARREVDA